MRESVRKIQLHTVLRDAGLSLVLSNVYMQYLFSVAKSGIIFIYLLGDVVIHRSYSFWATIAVISFLAIDYFGGTLRLSNVRKANTARRLLRMIDEMPVAVMTVNLKTFRISYANETSKALIRSIEHLLPIRAEDLVGSSIDVFHKAPQHQHRILSDPRNLPYCARIKLGPEVLDLKVSAITDDDGSYIGPMLTWAIVTKEVETEERLRHLAHYDPLTGLANRATFNEEMESRLARSCDVTALLFLDLDGFKLINDTLGHQAGDDLLRFVSDRLRGACADRSILISRLGGDEFAILVPSAQLAELKSFARELVETLSEPYELNDLHKVQIGVSIGIALAPSDGETVKRLSSRADIALYAAKSDGKGTFKFFSEDLEAKVRDHLCLQTDLRDALQSGNGLFIFYQPILDAITKAVTCREALLRWFHPTRGWISPDEFIPVAERSDLINELGEYVLGKACHDAASWPNREKVAVNISPVQLGRGKLPQLVLAALTSSGISPDRLEIEVTETAVIRNEQGSIGELRRLRAMGVHIALDDFGTGFSTFTTLSAFAFDKIKIDRSFVKAAVVHPEAAAIVGAIAHLGRRLGIITVAEGVETEADLQQVLSEGCLEVQGYFYGKPEPTEQDARAVAALEQETTVRAAGY